jgi:hypothetical protein
MAESTGRVAWLAPRARASVPYRRVDTEGRGDGNSDPHQHPGLVAHRCFFLSWDAKSPACAYIHKLTPGRGCLQKYAQATQANAQAVNPLSRPSGWDHAAGIGLPKRITLPSGSLAKPSRLP